MGGMLVAFCQTFITKKKKNDSFKFDYNDYIRKGAWFAFIYVFIIPNVYGKVWNALIFIMVHSQQPVVCLCMVIKCDSSRTSLSSFLKSKLRMAFLLMFAAKQCFCQEKRASLFLCVQEQPKQPWHYHGTWIRVALKNPLINCGCSILRRGNRSLAVPCIGVPKPLSIESEHTVLKLLHGPE